MKAPVVPILIGDLWTAPQVSVFTAVHQADVNILMISQGASKINIAFVVENDDAHRAVTALHRKFFS